MARRRKNDGADSSSLLKQRAERVREAIRVKVYQGTRRRALQWAPAHHKEMWQQMSEMLEAGLAALRPAHP